MSPVPRRAAAVGAAARPCPPLLAAGARPRRGTRVLVPWRLVEDAAYSDAALSVYIKVAALAAREDGCEARVETIAAYLGMSKSAVERALRQLTRPHGAGQVIEVPTTRRTYRGGTGQSAHRTVRAVDTRVEDFVWVPTRAAEALTPRLLRAYAVLAYATARRIPLSAGDLGELLHHHTGAAAGTHLGERTARRIITALAATGWITVHHRSGHQGRHAYEVHRTPLHPVPAATGPVGPDTGDGSGPGDHDGSLASKEDPTTDPPDHPRAGFAIRRRRTTGSRAVDTHGNGAAGADRGYTGPGLQLSPRVWAVLAPVHHLLPGIRPYLLRRIAHEVGTQLDAGGATVDRLRTRLTHRYATTTPVADPGRWILGAGLRRHGCGLPECEQGVLLRPWAPPERCHACREPGAHYPDPPPPARPPQAPRTTWCTCPDCPPATA